MVGIHKRKVNGVEVSTREKQIAGANLLDVEVGTTGLKGGDSGYGGRTYFRITDAGGTDIRISSFNPIRDNNGSVVIELGGDSELLTLIDAFKYAVRVLEAQILITSLNDIETDRDSNGES